MPCPPNDDNNAYSTTSFRLFQDSLKNQIWESLGGEDKNTVD